MTTSGNGESGGHTRIAHRTCPLCEATCGLEIRLDGDRVVDIRGDREDVFSRGFVCPKGATLKQLHEDPDRLRRPLVRDGDRWQEVDWDEAFQRVDRGLTEVIGAHGRQAVAVYLGNPNVHNLGGIIYGRPFLKALGTRNIFSASTVDQMPKHVSSALLFGHPRTIAVPDLDRTDYLLMLGANPWASNGSLCTAPDFPGRLKALRARGGKLVVVDPRSTRTARHADEHLFVRPGTDAHLLFAIVATLFDEDRVELRHLEPHVAGLERVRELAAPFSPDRVAPVCGIEPGTIRRLARELADATSAAVYGRMGTCTVAFGTLASWLVDVLNVLTGNLDRPGGAMFPRSAHSRHRSDRKPGGRGYQLGRWRSRVRDLPEVMGELPVATLADEIETPGPGQVRALVTIAGNPVLSTPNGDRLDAALASLEFMVSVDPYRNETTRRAHVILPPASPLTQGHSDLAFYDLAVHNVARYSPPVLEPGDTVAESEILLRLALIAAGQGAGADPGFLDDLVIAQVVGAETSASGSPVAGRDPNELIAALGPRRGPERVLDFLLRAGPYGDHFGANPEGLSLAVLEAHPHGIDLGPLEPRIPEILTTPSGQIELAPEAIVADVPRLAATLDEQAPAGLVLVGRRHLRSNNSWMHNIGVLVRGKDRCTLQIHPADAARIGLVHGALARVTSRVGTIEIPVAVTADIMPGVVSIPHGWGHDLPGVALSVARERPGVNSNRLADEAAIDPLSGNAVLNGIPVTVEGVG